jgi:hypothetical protein
MENKNVATRVVELAVKSNIRILNALVKDP